MAVLVGFLYKNLGVTLAFPLHLLSPTVSEANREGRTDYYRYYIVCSSDSIKPLYNRNYIKNIAKHLFKRYEIIVNKLLSKNEVEVQI
jgi:hypothetical protein